MPSERGAARRWAADLVVVACGLLAALTNCAFVFRPLSSSALSPVDSFISELEVPGQPDSAFFRYASLLSGLLAAVLAIGLLVWAPRTRAGAIGCWALVVFGVTGVVDALVPMDCAPSASAICLRAEESGPASWPFQAHSWFDVAGSAALLVSLWFLARGLRSSPRWRRSSETGRIGFAVLTALSVLLTVMSAWYLPGTGLVQRLVVLLTSVWLVVLSVDLLDSARRGAPEVRDAPAAGWPEPTARVIGGVVTLGALFSVLSVVARGVVPERGGGGLRSGQPARGALPVQRRAPRAAGRGAAPAAAAGAVGAGAVPGAGAGRRRGERRTGGQPRGPGARVRRFGETDRADLAVSAATAAALIPLLVMARTAFPARLYPASRRPAAVVLVSGLAVSAATALVLTWISPATLGGPGSGSSGRCAPSSGSTPPAPTRTATCTGARTGWPPSPACLRPGPHGGDRGVPALGPGQALPDRPGRAGHPRAAARNGRRDSLGYFATRHDKSVVFYADRSAAVTYRVLANVSLASADPIGPVEDWPAAIEAWLAEARTFGWFPAVPRPARRAPGPTSRPGSGRCRSVTRRSSTSTPSPSIGRPCSRCGGRSPGAAGRLRDHASSGTPS